MVVVTIPKKMAKEDLVLISKKEYEELLRVQKTTARGVAMTLAQKRALARGRKNYQSGKTLSLNDFSKGLGLKDR